MLHKQSGEWLLMFHYNFVAGVNSAGWSKRRDKVRIGKLVHAVGGAPRWTRNTRVARHVQRRAFYISSRRLAVAFPNG